MTDAQFIAACATGVFGIMVLLQTILNKRVWAPYIIGFFVAAICLAASFR